tara:strand:- start:201 stop:338 length:138 start_codon:yes stop_codon:yes gene_type:complete
MIIEEKVVKILKHELSNLERFVKWDGMYDNIATKIVKEVKKEIVK